MLYFVNRRTEVLKAGYIILQEFADRMQAQTRFWRAFNLSGPYETTNFQAVGSVYVGNVSRRGSIREGVGARFMKPDFQCHCGIYWGA